MRGITVQIRGIITIDFSYDPKNTIAKQITSVDINVFFIVAISFNISAVIIFSLLSQNIS